MGTFECCHHCVDRRTPGCHSWCQDYKDAKIAFKQPKSSNDIYDGYVNDKWSKIYHNQNRKAKR